MRAAVSHRRPPLSSRDQVGGSPPSEAIRGLSRVLEKRGPSLSQASAYRVGDAIGKPHKLNRVLALSPFWPQSEYEVEGRVVRVGVIVGQRYVL
jgi:hypothetical protein